MNRNDKVLHKICQDEPGLEIGPSHNPIAPKKDGFNVKILDHMTKEGLIEKYKEHHINLQNIEEVDYVWNGEKYSKLIGDKHCFKWIIASHLIEHTPDLVSFLNDCDELLSDDGILSLVIPDKRFCFDHYRPITSLSNVIDANYHNHTIHSPGTVAEYFLNVVSKSGQIAWDSNHSGQYEFVHTLMDAKNGMQSVINDSSYLDVHSWCFVPSSFRLIINDLFNLGLISLKEVCYFPTSGSEFYVSLSRNGGDSCIQRLDILNSIEDELNSAEGEHNSAEDQYELILENPGFFQKARNHLIKCLTNKDKSRG